MSSDVQQIVILGNGIAGITAARHIRKRSDHEITVISGETDHFFSRTALMYIYMGHMRFEDTKPYEDHFWDKNRIRLRRAWVEAVEVENKKLRLAGGAHVPYDVLILATGSKSNKFGWPGQDLDGVQGLYSYPDLELMERNSQDTEHAVVIGGGLIGVEMSEMLHSRGIGVSFLVREQHWMDFAFPREESELIEREIRRHGIDLRMGTELDHIEADARGRACKVVSKATGSDGPDAGSNNTIPCQFVGLTVGVSPNVEFLRGSKIECDRGILVDEHLRTSVPDVYATGDCAQLRQPKAGRRPTEPVWYVGRTMGETVAHTICGDETAYVQDVWFNSAKFFDLEWQVYGDVPADSASREPDDIGTLYWQHPDQHLAIRVNYKPAEGTPHDGPVTGFQLMGVRYRHEVCDEWLRTGTSVRSVLENLGVANFDPEFYRQHESALVSVYNQRFPDHPVTLRRKRGLKHLFRWRKAS